MRTVMLKETAKVLFEILKWFSYIWVILICLEEFFWLFYSLFLYFVDKIGKIIAR